MATSSLEVLEGVTHKFQGRFYCTPCMCKICHQALLGAGCMCKICRFPVHKACTKLNPTGCVKISPKDLVKNTVKAGLLQKHSSMKTKSKAFGFRAVLGKSTRYCILTQDHIIFYFKDINSEAACGAIALTDCSKVEKLQTRGFSLHQEGERDPSGGPPLSEGKDYAFTAESASERDDWVDIIDSFLHLLDRKTLVESITLNSQAQKQEHSQKLRHCRYLEVKLLQAKDLPAMDISGTSDTYWMLKCQDTVHRSETIWKNNKDPRWDECFNFPLPHDVDEDSQLVLTAWDKDMWSADDLMAMRSIRFGDVFTMNGPSEWKRGWYDLHPVTYGDLEGGDVHLGVCRKKEVVTVHVIQCRNLGVTSHSTGHPMVKVLFGKIRKKTEPAKKVVDDPLFDTTFELPLKIGAKEVIVEVWAMHTFSGTCLGRVVLEVERLPDRRKVEEWYRLSSTAKASGGSHTEPTSKRQMGALGAPGSLGKVQLELRYTDQAILPTDHYDELLALVTDEKLELALALAATVKAEKEDVGRALLRAFASDGQSREVHLIRELVRWELEGTLNAGVIFRQNTVVTKAVDAHLRLFGTIYLRNVLGSLVTEINQGKKSFEVDPTKAQKGDDIEKNMRRLHELCAEVLERIFSQLDECPLQMREVFKCILQEVFMKFADDESLAVVKYTCITGFLFLRFFVAALLSPHLYDLLSEPPTKVGERNLKLVGKVLQTLANMKEFGDREPFMKEINAFIMDNQKGLQEYTHSIAVVLPEAPVVAAGDRIFLDFELAVLSKTIEQYKPAILEYSKDSPEFCARLNAVQDRIKGSYAELKTDASCKHVSVGTSSCGSLRIPKSQQEQQTTVTRVPPLESRTVREASKGSSGEWSAHTFDLVDPSPMEREKAGAQRRSGGRSGTLMDYRSSQIAASAVLTQGESGAPQSVKDSSVRTARSLSAAPAVTNSPRQARHDERFAGVTPKRRPSPGRTPSNTSPIVLSDDSSSSRSLAVNSNPQSVASSGRSRSAARSNLERPIRPPPPPVECTTPGLAQPRAPLRSSADDISTHKTLPLSSSPSYPVSGGRADTAGTRDQLLELELLAASVSSGAKPRRSDQGSTTAAEAAGEMANGSRVPPAAKVPPAARPGATLAPKQPSSRLERSPGLMPQRLAEARPFAQQRAASTQAVTRNHRGRGQAMRGRGRGQHVRRGSGGAAGATGGAFQRGRGAGGVPRGRIGGSESPRGRPEGQRGRSEGQRGRPMLASSVDTSMRRVETVVAKSTENVFAAAGLPGPMKKTAASPLSGGRVGGPGAGTDAPPKLRFVQRSHRTDVVVNE